MPAWSCSTGGRVAFIGPRRSGSWTLTGFFASHCCFADALMPQTSASRPSQRSKGQKPRPSADEERVRAIYGSEKRRYFPRSLSKTGPTKRWITAIASGMFWPSSMLNLIPLSQDKEHHQYIDERHESAHRTPGNVRVPAHCQFHSPCAHLRSLSSEGAITLCGCGC